MAMAEVQIKATHKVKPAEKTWTGTVTLTVTDMKFRRNFIPLLYLYRPARALANATETTTTLTASLAKALVHFYPFAGRLRFAEAGAVVLECDEAASWVPLVEAEETSGVEVAELGLDLPEASWAVERKRFQKLIPAVDLRKSLHELPLLVAQLTHFRCGGVSLGFLLSHAVADGFGMGHLLSEWARLARGLPMEMEPVHDRTLMGAGELPRFVPTSSMKKIASFAGLKDRAGTIMNLVVSKSQMHCIKKVVGDSKDGRPYSRFEVLAAHVWRCLSRTRERQGDYVDVLGFPVDFRKRMGPSFPPTYFGNASFGFAAMSKSSELNSSPLGYPCGILRRLINDATSGNVRLHIDRIRSHYDGGVWQGLILTPEGHPVMPDLILSSWLTLSIYGLDFGWGKEPHMANLVPPIGGSCYLMPGREEGSTIVAICVKVGQAEVFKNYFYHNLV